jgi:hypothetical protein
MWAGSRHLRAFGALFTRDISVLSYGLTEFQVKPGLHSETLSPKKFTKTRFNSEPIAIEAKRLQYITDSILGQVWWCMSVIPATREVAVGESQPAPGKVSLRTYLKNKLKQKGMCWQ